MTEKIKKYSLYSLLANEKKFENIKGTFHNFGVDILIDSKFNPWVMEVNVFASGFIESEAKLEVLSGVGRDLGNIIT